MTGPTILIVDDEPLNVKLLAAHLPRKSYNTLLAYNGSTAIEMAREHKPDLILLDVMMPNLSGYEVIKILKEDPQTENIPIILVTALNETSDKVAGFEAGADEFLCKPINSAELLVRVKSLLKLKQYRDQLTAHADAKKLTVDDIKGLPVGRGGHKPTILIGDDDEVDLKLLRAYLQDEFYEIRVAKTGNEVLNEVSKGEVDVVLLDILLPDMNGFDLCFRLKSTAEYAHTQVLELTCLSDLESKIRGFEMGADDFLVKPVNRAELKVRIRVLVKKKRYLDKLQARCKTAIQVAIVDQLTGLYNRAYFDHFIEVEIKRALRQNRPLSLVLIDIDDFKLYNDQLGHLAGDRILKELGRLLRHNFREIDLGARYGGEEFVMLLPDTDLIGAKVSAERALQVINEYAFDPDLKISAKEHLTVSMGIAASPAQATTAKELFAKADRALYQAKADGKNRVVVSGQETGGEVFQPVLTQTVSRRMLA